VKLTKAQKYGLWSGIAVLLLVWLAAATPLGPALGIVKAPLIGTDVSGIGEAPAKWRSIFGIELPGGLNIVTMVMTWAIMGLILFFGFSATRRPRRVPGRLQLLFEMFVGFFDQICADSMGPQLGRKYVPFVATIFIFVFISNWIGVVPGLEEPTRDLNTCLGLGVICFFVAHVSGIRYKGWKKYLLEYVEPVGPLSPFFLVINVVGEIGKTLSHSIRLYGNVMGGAVLILVINQLSKQLPPLSLFLTLWFGLFVGLVQAFVFAMLAMTYIAVKVGD